MTRLKICYYIIIIMIPVGMAAIYWRYKDEKKKADIAFLIFDIGIITALLAALSWLYLGI